VKTGPIAVGSSLQGPLASFKAGATNSVVYAMINLAGSLTFTAPACQVSTASVTVNLPTVTNQAFTGVDSVAGTTPFQIGLTCSSGATVSITMDTATPVAGKPGVIAPSSGSAGGVGVQVLDSSGVTPVQFGVAQTIGATPDGALSVSYFARYYQTGSAVSAGLLGATATFTLSYQ
jgi:type 1 fimbria pilin